AILTAARSGEVLNATWSEFDLKAGVWEIPGIRMKGGRTHRVPLSRQAIELLQNLPVEDGNVHVFIGARPGKPLSREGLQWALEKMDRTDIAAHGFRSTFRDWAAERTAFPFEVAETALAHSVGNKASRAYRRTDWLDERARLMQSWADYCDSPVVEGDVVVP